MFNTQLELITTGICPGNRTVSTEELAQRAWTKYSTDGTPLGDPQITSPDEIIKRLGVVSRPRASEDQTHASMFNSAVEMAIREAEGAGHKVRNNVVALFAGTSQDPRRIPDFLHEVSAHAGLHPNHYRELISQACSSANNGVTRLSDYAEANPAISGYAVVGAAEIFASLWKPDNFDSMMFGDAATAAIFKITPSPNLPPEKRGIVGCVNIHTPDAESRIIRGDDGCLYMDGKAVMRFAPKAMLTTFQRSLAIADLEPGQINKLVFHPGSAHIYGFLKGKADELMGRGLTRDEAPHYLEEFGNNGAATTLNTIHQERMNGKFGPGQRVYVGSIGMGFYESGFIIQT